MKKTFLILISSFWLFASAQKDSVKDTISILSFQQVSEIVNDIQLQQSGKVDVKKEVWNDILQTLYRSLIVRTLPNKELPKK